MNKHSIKLFGHDTSITLEPIFWQELSKIAEEKGVSVRKLVESIDEGRRTNLSSAIRVYVLEYVLTKNASD